jgi:endonuclease YncB( thermonuclease family)
VVAVHDGDTVSVRREHDTVRVRLACIDAPEQGQAFGTRAKRELAELVLNRPVRLDVIDRDRYGRLVARLWANDVDVSLAMVKRGMAWHYRHHCPDEHALAAAESDARQAKRGLWQERDRVPPWQWRRR